MFCKLKKKCHQRLSVLLQNSIGIRLAKSTFYQLMTANPPAVRQAWSMQWSNTALLHRVQRRCVCRQNIKTRRKPLKKMGYFDRVTVSLHILCTANQETEGSQDRLTVLFLTRHALRATYRAPARIWLAVIDFQNSEQQLKGSWKGSTERSERSRSDKKA